MQNAEENSKLPTSFSEVGDWLSDRLTDVKGWANGIYHGTSRKGYRSNNVPAEPTLNSVIDGFWGDERDSVKVIDLRTNKTYGRSVTMKSGTYKVVMNYICNSSKGIAAEDVVVCCQFSDVVSKGQPGQIIGLLSASNTDPGVVTDSVKIKAKQKLRLRYVEGSARISCSGKIGGTKLSEDLFNTKKGTMIGYDSFNGRLPAGKKYAGKITFKVKVTKAA